MIHSVSRPGHAELTVRRSRFIADLAATKTREESEEILRARRADYADASHVVYAFVIGGENAQTVGMSDDHEPHGTAGRPVLDILLGRRLTNAIITVVRFFGGTKLGKGGLVRAYSEAARLAIDAAVIEELRETVAFRIQIEYAYYDAVRRFLKDSGTSAIREEFGTGVVIEGEIDVQDTERLQQFVADLTRGDQVLRFAPFNGR